MEEASVRFKLNLGEGGGPKAVESDLGKAEDEGKKLAVCGWLSKLRVWLDPVLSWRPHGDMKC